MLEFLLFLCYATPILAVLAICAFIADVILPRFPGAVDWINEFLKERR